MGPRGRADQDRRAAFAVRHHGDFRNHAEGHRPDDGRTAERQWRASGPPDRGGGRRSGIGLAAVCRKGPRIADRQRRGCDLRLLDQRQPQVGAAGDRGTERPAVLSRAVRGRGILEERHLHRRRAEPAGDPGGGLHGPGTGRREMGTAGNRLCLSAHHEQHPGKIPDRQRTGRRQDLRELHAVRPFRLVQGRLGRRRTGGRRQEGRGRIDHQRRRECGFLQGTCGGRRQCRRHSGDGLLGRRRGTVRAGYRQSGRSHGGLELFRNRRHARKRSLHQGMAQIHRRRQPGDQ